ncbi:MAG: cupredoxin domain-containing protein [Candidatus Kerfeldbacteria bacterium]
MKKYLVPLSVFIAILLVGAACSKSTKTTTTTNTSGTNTNSGLNQNLNANTLNSNSNTNGSAASNLNTNSTNTSATTASSSVAVSLVNFSFVPSTITVQRGGTVTFTNNDSTGHTVQVDGGTDHAVAAGATYTLDTSNLSVGDHTLRCTIHPSMTGTITIVQG